MDAVGNGDGRASGCSLQGDPQSLVDAAPRHSPSTPSSFSVSLPFPPRQKSPSATIPTVPPTQKNSLQADRLFTCTTYVLYPINYPVWHVIGGLSALCDSIY